MKKLFYLALLLAAALSPAHAQEQPHPDSTRRLVVARYTDHQAEIPVAESEELEPIKKWRLAVDGGYTHRIGKFDESVTPSGITRMRSGFMVQGELLRFAGINFGFGARFTGKFYAPEYMGAKMKIRTLYFAPTFMYRILTGQNGDAWTFAYSMGYVDYKEKSSYKPWKKGAMGVSFDIGYDIRLTGWEFMGLRVSLFGAMVNTGERDSDDKKIGIDMSSVDLTLGFRF